MANTHSIDLELSSSQWLSITDASQTGLDITGDISIECWINIETLPSVVGVLESLVDKSRTGSGSDRAYLFYINTTDVLTFRFDANADGTNESNFTSDAVIVDSGDLGNWIHLAVTVDVSVPSVVMYKDGSSIASSSTATGSTSINNNAEDFRIGARNAGGTRVSFFDGLMDGVRVWNDIRTGTEIADNRSLEISGGTAGLAGAWRLNNDLLDETTNNNDLTNNNTALFSTSVPFVTPPALKTRNTVADASIKTGNTVAIANIKTWNTAT